MTFNILTSQTGHFVLTNPPNLQLVPLKALLENSFGL